MMTAFENFKQQLEDCDWEKPSDIMDSFRTADIVTCTEVSNRVVFNIGGNKYRMICGYHFGTEKVTLFIKFVGTHSEYDRVDVCKVKMF